jgi:hypothetical protein
MNPLLVAPLFELGANIINRVFPDPEKRAAAELELLKLTTDGDLKKILGQLEINAKEAAHPSVLVAGWRPGAGWVGVAGFAYASVIHPLLTWLASAKGWPLPPAVDTDILFYVLGGMLGLGTLRTVEKSKGLAK